jgi:hypothetical protein
MSGALSRPFSFFEILSYAIRKPRLKGALSERSLSLSPEPVGTTASANRAFAARAPTILCVTVPMDLQCLLFEEGCAI